MSRLDEFLRLLCGRFDNTRQLEELRRSGGPALPLAEHVNTVCNDKIDGLPADFAGAFVLEESYYTTEGKTHASPHLFLFTEEGEAVKLTSYQPVSYTHLRRRRNDRFGHWRQPDLRHRRWRRRCCRRRGSG